MTERPEWMPAEYFFARQLPDGRWAAVNRQVYTWALMVGLDEYGYETRFCYETCQEAATALAAWDGKGFPPSYWIKQKPEGIAGPKRENS